MLPFTNRLLLQAILRLNILNQKKILITKSRSSTILPFMVGYTIGVFNGFEFCPINISSQMVGHKLGEFAITRTFRFHNSLSEIKIKR